MSAFFSYLLQVIKTYLKASDRLVNQSFMASLLSLKDGLVHATED